MKNLDTGFAYNAPDDVFRTALETNLFHFSAAKTLAEVQELNRLLREAKNYADFRRKAEKVARAFNDTWQRTEYDTAVLTAEATENYRRLRSKQDVFPYWEYLTVGDGRVREEHQKLHGVVLASNDEFWNKIYPPNGWNCFEAGTLVLMADGTWKNIENICRGDSVISGSGQAQLVTGTHINPFNGEAVRIFTKRGAATCTPNHRFLTSEGWVTADRLQTGNILIQVGKVSTLDKAVNAIHNLASLFRYGLMTLVRKWKSV